MILLLALVLVGCSDLQNTFSTQGVRQTGLGEPPPNMERLVRIGDETFENGDIADAAEIYYHAHQLDPAAPEPLVRLARSMAAGGAHAEAVDVFRKALGLAPGHPEALRGLGASLIATEEPTKALAAYDTLLAADPEDHRAHNGRGIALDLLRRHERAQASYRAGLAIAPSDRSLRNNLGLSLMLAARHDEATELLIQAATTPCERGACRERLPLVSASFDEPIKPQWAIHRTIEPAQSDPDSAFFARLSERLEPVPELSASETEIPVGSTLVPSGHYRIQLAAHRTEADAKTSWTALKRQEGDLLGDLTLFVQRADLGPGKGIYFRAQTGTMLREEATWRCNALKKRGVHCFIVRAS